jgi:hypothetical protein
VKLGYVSGKGGGSMVAGGRVGCRRPLTGYSVPAVCGLSERSRVCGIRTVALDPDFPEVSGPTCQRCDLTPS